jgi:hypothetical protein
MMERIWKESVGPNFKELSRNFPGGTEENHKNPQSGYPVSGPRLKPGAFQEKEGCVLNRPTTAFGE